MSPEVHVEVVERVAAIRPERVAEAGSRRGSARGLLAVVDIGEAAVEQVHFGLRRERASRIEERKTCGDLRHVDGRSRVLPGDAPEEVEVELDVLGEERLGERRIVDRRGAE